MSQQQPKNRIKNLSRAEKSVNQIRLALEQLRERNNSSIERNGLNLFTVNFVCRLLNINFAEMQFHGFTDINRNAVKYYYILAGLLIQGRPVTRTYLMDFLGVNHVPCNKIIDNLINSGYIAETKARRHNNFKGKIIYKTYDTGIMLTAQGIDKLTFLNDLLTDKRLF